MWIDPCLGEDVIEVVSATGVVRRASMRDAEQAQVVRRLIDAP